MGKLMATASRKGSKGRAPSLATRTRSGIEKGKRGQTQVIRRVQRKQLGHKVSNKPTAPPSGDGMEVIHGQIDTGNDKSGVSFPYQPFNEAKLEIRLITILCGIDDEPITCTLEHVATNRGSRPNYKALSYTWGSPEDTRTISIDGINVQVRENLWQALYHLRDDGDRAIDLQLWIEAVCISQNDISKRNRQVSRMSAIYSLASEVLIWLGPQSDGSDVAMSFIDQTYGGRSSNSLPDHVLDETFKNELPAIEYLLDRDYWKRVWVIQEVFRARKLTIHCGD